MQAGFTVEEKKKVIETLSTMAAWRNYVDAALGDLKVKEAAEIKAMGERVRFEVNQLNKLVARE